MVARLDPLVSEFATQEDAESYDAWFRNKVQTSLKRADDGAEPRHTGDEVLREMDSVIRSAELKHAKRRLA